MKEDDDKDEIVENFVQIPSPCSIICCGRSGCGKSQLLLQIIKHRDKLVAEMPRRIIWCYSVDDPLFFRQLPPEVELVRGLPDMETLGLDKKEGSIWLILDDLQESLDQNVCRLFTAYSHKRNLTLFLLLQNFFFSSGWIRTISLNAHILILFPNQRDMSQFHRIASQVSPKNRQFLIDVYEEIAREPYSYLLIDTSVLCPEHLRIRSDILNEEGCIVWHPPPDAAAAAAAGSAVRPA